MRHRASRPLPLALWHRLPRATARLLGEAAELGPVRALVALMVMLSLGTGAYVTGASLMGGSTTGHTESAGIGEHLGPTASRDSGRPNLTAETPASDGRTPSGTTSESGTPAAGQPASPSPTTGEPSTLRSELGPVTGSPSTATATPSPSSSQPSATESTSPPDVTPPTTSLSEEYPAGDAARFSFSADEPASFTCSLDGAAYTACSTPTTYSDLDPGWHTFAVRATDAAGNVDPSPAEIRWHASEGHSAGQ